MPILIKDYTWSETESQVTLTVPLKGVKQNKADIFSSNSYIKINFPPYFFEVQLYRPVIEDQCTVRIGNGVILFTLVKEEKGIWGQLYSEEDKESMIEKRKVAVDHAQKQAEQDRAEKAKKKRDEEQFAIKKQMKLDEEERERIEKEKQDERDKATEDVEKWKTQPVTKRDVWTGKVERSPPPLRKTGSITVHFTPRPFTTAARESKFAEEQEWLAKMAAARKIKPPENSEENINEHNPEFLKDKGIEFFKACNYEAAINVFSEALRLNELLPSLYSNRAACYLCTGDLEKCISDCCRALELYYPVVSSNYVARTKVFVRRGTAYAKGGRLDLAVQDYDAAIKLSPNDEKLKEDYYKLKQFMLSNN